MLWVQSERQEFNGSRQRVEAVVAEAKRLQQTYDGDEMQKINADVQLVTTHWQNLLDRYVGLVLRFIPSDSGYIG